MTLKKVLFLSLIGLLIAAVIISGIFFFFIKKDSTEESVKEYYLYTLDELYTNIKDSTKILKINITLEYTDKNLLGNLEDNRAKLTNDVLELLRNKTLEDLSGESGQQKSRNDILVKVKQIFNTKDVSNVYFTEFIIQ